MGVRKRVLEEKKEEQTMGRLKCRRKGKTCKQILYFSNGKGVYICSGVNKKPTKFKKDNIWICLKGHYIRKPERIEMTRGEALTIVAALCAALSEGIV